MKFLVIGADAAGMSAASRVKRNLPDADVTVLEKTEDVSYSACGLPYNIGDPGRDLSDLVVRKAEVFRSKQGINLLTGHTATRLDLSAQTVTATAPDGNDALFGYDKLLIATGASAVIPGIPGTDLPGVFALKTLGDGRSIKTFLERNSVRKAVIIGMGYIGLEMCEALRERNIDVSMMEMSETFIPWMNPALSDYVKEETEAQGVRLHVGYPAEKIERTGGALSVISGDLALEADMVILALGVTPNTGFASEAGLETGPSREIVVTRNLETSSADIYAAGDCADAYHVVTGSKIWIPLALRANRAGWAVADNVCGIRTELPGVAGTAVFKLFHLQVARTGLNPAEAEKSGFDPVEAVVKTRSRAHGHPGSNDIHVQITGDRKTGKLLGFQMVGHDGVAHRINAPAVALHAGMTVEEYAQSDLAYAPPFGPVWDPTLTAAIQLMKKL